MYSDGLRHSLELPYQVFEDQRSGETLGKLQKVRIDVEKLIQSFVNVLFTALVGIIFVMWYAITVYWPIALGYFLTIPLLGILSFAAEQANQGHSEDHRGRNHGPGRLHHRKPAQHRAD